MRELSQEELAEEIRKARADIEGLMGRKLSIMGDIEAHVAANRSKYVQLFNWQRRGFEDIRRNNITVAIAPNKIGKTGFGANTVISWALGEEPWSGRESSLGIEPPVDIRITGEDLRAHLGGVVIPELKKWAPKGEYRTYKRGTAFEIFWEWRNGSTFELMTYEQGLGLYESWMGHGWWPDEPPPEQIFTAMARGLFGTGGKVLMTSTPLKEDWMLDELVLSGRRDVAIINGLTILDNDMWFLEECGILLQWLVVQELKTYFKLLLFVDDQGEAAEEFLREKIPVSEQETPKGDIINGLKLLRFIKDVTLAEKPARVFGQFKSLVGKCVKTYKPSVHLIDEFPIPPSWPVIPVIDLHVSEKQAMSFYATDKRQIRYVIEEVWENISPEKLAEAIIRKKLAHQWTIPFVIIDALSRGDQAFSRNRYGETESSFDIIRSILGKHGIELIVGSKDVDSGVLAINDAFKGLNNMPSLYLFKGKCLRHQFELSRWVYGPNNKPLKKNDHFMENTRRFLLAKVKYEKPVNFNNLVGGHPAHRSGSPHTAGSWMTR